MRKKDIDNLSIILGITAPEETEEQKKRGRTRNTAKRTSSKSSTNGSTTAKKEQPARYRNVGARKRGDLTPTRGETFTVFKTAVISQLWEDFKALCSRNDMTIRDGIAAALCEYINKNTAKK